MENNNSQTNQPYIPPEVYVERKSHLDKLAEVFLPEDLDSIGSRIYSQVIIPMILKTAGDIIHRSIDMIFGTNYTGTPAQTNQSSAQSWTNYRQPIPNGQPAQGTTQIIPIRSGTYDYNMIRYRTIEEAQGVLNNMRGVIQNSGSCSIGKYMDFLGEKTLPEDYNWGWTNLSTVKLQKTGDPNFPYRMVLPTPAPIQKPSSDIYI